MKLKDLFLEEKNYIVGIEIPNTNYMLFIEGLNEFGESINREFNINNIKTFCIELLKEEINNVYEFYEDIDPTGITLDETKEDLIEKTINLLNGDVE